MLALWIAWMNVTMGIYSTQEQSEEELQNEKRVSNTDKSKIQKNEHHETELIQKSKFDLADTH